ncbi:MAG: sulfotransferase domain-containing protein [Bacteroidales bacterium]|jgi:hypothetical protein
MEDQTKTFAYKLVRFAHKLINKLGKNISKAAEELNYLKFKMEFGEQDDDIYIITYPKSGTTLMQMLLYQLTTNGEINFKHIYDVSPWLRNDAFKKHKPRLDLPSPRLIKSHDPYEYYDKATKGRFIFIIRDGMDVAVSLYHQRKNYGTPNLEFDSFFKGFMKPGKMNWFTFNRKWLENKNKLPVIYITYEELTAHFDRALKKVAAFCNIQVPDSELPRIRERCSFEFMKKHEDKFGEQPPEPKPQFIFDQFIRKGKSGEGKEELNDLQKKHFIVNYCRHIQKFEPLFQESSSMLKKRKNKIHIKNNTTAI